MNLLVIYLVAVQTFAISGRLTVLRGKLTTHGYSYDERKLICATEEDEEGALVWNTNLIWKYRSYGFLDRGANGFSRPDETSRLSGINCNLNSLRGCTEHWDIAGWSLTNSTTDPMGPVFDSRWEDFREYKEFGSSEVYRNVEPLAGATAVVFSVRALSDAHFLFCNSDAYAADFCYWIIIGGWRNTESAIRKCAAGLPPLNDYTEKPDCYAKQARYLHRPLSATEWRTFVFTWNQTDRNISVYDKEKILLSYAENDQDRGSGLLQKPSRVFLRSSQPSLFRAHAYDFLRTTEPGTVITSPPMYIPTGEICFQVLLGLCTDCQMEILLVDSADRSVRKTLKVIAPIGTVHGLPGWQAVKINETVGSATIRFGNYVNIQLIAREAIEGPNRKKIWAVANFRSCLSLGASTSDGVRYGTMTAIQDYDGGRYYWPNVTCQRLSHDRDTVVSSISGLSFDLPLDYSDCPDARLGPRCRLSCEQDLEVNTDCGGSVICEESGCTCLAGFVGEDCNQRCSIGHYGRGCNETCGACYRDYCHFQTGRCLSGCENQFRYNIPPFCKTGIDKLPPPEIDFLGETTVKAVLPVEEQYKGIVTDYVYTIRKKDASKSDSRISKLDENTTKLVGSFEDLEPGTSYQISCSVRVKDSVTDIEGHWKDFTTRCTPGMQFELESSQRSITIKKDGDSEEPFACPSQWYEFLFENLEEKELLQRGNLDTLPQRLSDLTPYTLYKITISKGSAILFSSEVRTLEAAPSPVRNLASTLTSETEVTLNWTVPRFPNGVIAKYDITLKITAYLGCAETRMAPPRDLPRREASTESTTITVSGLHRYARYAGTVSACTAYCGEEASIEFETGRSEIPTARLSNLSLQDYVLRWSAPEDCTRISGPIPVARVIIDGLTVNAHREAQTKARQYPIYDRKSDNYLLDGAETYRARVYALRGYHKKHNDLVYADLTFTTPPRPPPKVRDLEVHEVDIATAEIHLRWKKPGPPTHGEVASYQIQKCNSRCLLIKIIPANEFCELWNDHVCAKLKMPDYTFVYFQVFAVNANVSRAGRPTSTKIVRREIAPETPENLTVSGLEKGLVDVRWSHPWRTGGHLKEFHLTVELLSSNLRRTILNSQKGMIYEYPVRDYKPVYREQISLLPSSSYIVSVQPITVGGLRGRKRSELVETPLAVAFQGNLTAELNTVDSTVRLVIPSVLNDTKDSLTSILVAGPLHCDHHIKPEPELSELANAVGGTDQAATLWRAATFSTDEIAGKSFVIGDKKRYSNATNCPLKPGEAYVIVVIVQTNQGSYDNTTMFAETASIRIGEPSQRQDEAWIIPLFVVLFVALATFYFYRRKKSARRHVKHQAMALSESKPVTTGVKSVPANSKESLCSPSTSIGEEESVSRGTVTGLTVAADGNRKEKRSSLVKVKDFEDYVRQAISTGLLEEQYQTFPRGQTRSWDYGLLPQNKPKNRYGNLIAYDETRVILEKLPDDPYSDYINANYITGYTKEKCYIATQGPKANTVIDFWRMIWQEECLIICMLSNVVEGGKTKCEQYWPDIGKRKKYGEVIVLNAKHSVFADYTLRTLHVTRADQTRKVEHLHFTAWPDHGVPLYTHSVVAYLKKVLAIPPGNGPVVVHCSAGVGRTGSIVLCDICLRRAAAEGVVDVFAETESIRNERANMVDNKQQYLFAHLVLVECLLSFPTALPCDETLPSRIKEAKEQLPVQRQRLRNIAWQDEALRPLFEQAALSKNNLAKNRFPELVSPKVGRIFLKRYPVTEEESDYISAVYVDGVRLQNQYIATQLPLPSTLSDFWRMVAELKIELIVVLQPPDPEDPTCCPIVPATEFKPTPYINVLTKDSTEMEYYTADRLLLTDNSEKPAREQQVTILSSTEWKPGREAAPPAAITLVALWQAAERVPRGDGPMAVLCHDGVTGCGLYLALSFLLERMSVERECDVCLAVRAVRRSRSDFAPSLEHMEYLYDAAITYLEYFETYANFT